MGVYAPHLVPLVAETMALLGTRHAYVVHGDTGSGPHQGSQSGIDELSISGPTQLASIHTLEPGQYHIILETITPSS